MGPETPQQYNHGSPKGSKTREGIILHGNKVRKVRAAETVDERKGTSQMKRWVYWARKKQLSQADNLRFSDTYVDSRGTQYVTEREKGTVRRVDLLQIPGVNRAEKLKLLRAHQAAQRKLKLAAPEMPEAKAA